MDEALENAAEAGLRTETHCIGDAALDMILGALERRLAKGGQTETNLVEEQIPKLVSKCSRTLFYVSFRSWPPNETTCPPR